MKSVEMIVEKREMIRNQMKHLLMQKNSIAQGREITQLSNEERMNYFKIESTLRLMNAQVNTLTYVINYDGELKDYSDLS